MLHIRGERAIIRRGGGLCLAVLAAVGLTGCSGKVPPAVKQIAAALPTGDLYSCSDSGSIGASGRLLAPAVLGVAPKAGGRTSEDIASDARLAAMSYAMYDAFNRGEDPNSALAPELMPIALIYGDPGVFTDRPAGRLINSRTFYGFVADDLDADRRYIVFRGTLQPAEWLRNLQAGQAPFPDGAPGGAASAMVHRGFLKIFQSLELVEGETRRPFAAALPELIGERDPVFIGHSLGGALATLAAVNAARLAPEQARRLRVATFASPRVGDAGFAAMARSVGHIDRVCNVVDLVPDVPPSTNTVSYTHVGEVFPISSFDWTDLNNALEKPSDLIACWHSIGEYAFMTSPTKSTLGLGACVK